MVNSYQNQYDTYDFIVDGISISLDNTILGQVVTRFSQQTDDVAVPIKVKNVTVIGELVSFLRYLTRNSSATELNEYAYLENINIGQAVQFVQVYGNNTGQRADIYMNRCTSTGSGVNLLDVGEFSNAITVRPYLENVSGFIGGNTDSFYIPTITCASGSITLNTNENRLDYTRQGRLVTISGRIRASSVSSPSGTVTISLPFGNQVGTQLSNWTHSPLLVADAVSKPANAFSLLQTGPGNEAAIVDVTVSVPDANVGAEFKAGTSVYVSYTYKTDN